jgi:hypothetical protein
MAVLHKSVELLAWVAAVPVVAKTVDYADDSAREVLLQALEPESMVAWQDKPLTLIRMPVLMEAWEMAQAMAWAGLHRPLVTHTIRFEALETS